MSRDCVIKHVEICISLTMLLNGGSHLLLMPPAHYKIQANRRLRLLGRLVAML